MKSALQRLNEIKAGRELHCEDSAEANSQPAPDGELVDGPLLEEHHRAVAWRLYSRRLGCELWLASDERAAADLVADRAGLPVLLLKEVPQLAGRSTEAIRAILAVKVAFPAADARLV